MSRPIGRRWTTAFVLSAFIPALTYYPAFALAGTFVKPSAYLPQGITNQILVWAVINALITLALMPFAPKRASRAGIVGQSVVIAVATVDDRLCRAVARRSRLQDRFPVLDRRAETDERQAVPDLPDLSGAVHGVFRDRAARPAPQFLDHGAQAARALYLTNILALTLGFIVLLVLQYGTLWLTGKLFNPLPDPGFVPLSTIVAIQFVPLLAMCAVIATFTWRRTGSSLPGALICGLFVTWYVVAGTATQAAF